MDILVSSAGVLTWQGRVYRCALGRNGVSAEKKEGDGTTPVGCFALREVLYRADKIALPPTRLPVYTIQKNDGWCDDPADDAYNKKITLPYPARHEELWREDDLYDLVIPFGYNDAPVVPGKGSALFIHVATPNYAPTEGCIALSQPDVLDLLLQVSTETKICVAE